MDELLAVIKDIVRLLKRDDIESSLFEDLKKGLTDRLDDLKGKLAVVTGGALAPIVGAPPDAELPPAPDHWAKEEPDPDASTKSAAAAPAGTAPVVTPAEGNSADIDAALSKLGSGAPLSDLPSTSLAEQEAALAAGTTPGGAPA